MATPHTLRFSQLDRQIPAEESESLFQSARRSGVRIVGACGGRGTCGTCVVHIVEGEVAHNQSKAHGELAKTPGAPPGHKKWVQACRVSARSDCTVEVAPRSLAPVVRAEMETGVAETLPLAPAVESREITLPEATLADNLSDHERLARALGFPIGIDLAAARQLPGALRDGKWSLRAHLRSRELIATSRIGRPTLGLAVDLGTTNAAAFLIDLVTGQVLAKLGIENPQVAWGADLISRINAAVKSESAALELRAAAQAAINALAHDLCHAVGAATDDIVDVAVCGNTAMHHLLLGLPVGQLGRAPFVAALAAALDLKARDLGLNTCPGAYVHVVANVGGFVGGDHVTALLATEERWASATTSIVMDIGTNTEISLIHNGEFLTASAPSGPALEGGHISCGMRAADGAIERVGLSADGRITVEVIGGQEAIGLCGSGVLDAVATLHSAGIMDDRGRLLAGHADVIEVNGKRAAMLAPNVYFTQDDIRAVQLAKAAIRTAVDMLLQLAGLQEQDIERFIIAGAFGAYIDVDSGIATGLFPALPRERYVQVGNAAGVGVRRILASTDARARADVLARGCRYIELSTMAEFQKRFLQRIGFPRGFPPNTGKRNQA